MTEGTRSPQTLNFEENEYYFDNHVKLYISINQIVVSTDNSFIIQVQIFSSNILLKLKSDYRIMVFAWLYSSLLEYMALEFSICNCHENLAMVYD